MIAWLALSALAQNTPQSCAADAARGDLWPWTGAVTLESVDAMGYRTWRADPGSCFDHAAMRAMPATHLAWVRYLVAASRILAEEHWSWTQREDPEESLMAEQPEQGFKSRRTLGGELWLDEERLATVGGPVPPDGFLFDEETDQVLILFPDGEWLEVQRPADPHAPIQP